MSALDQVKTTLKTKEGKVLAALTAGGLAYLWWSRGRVAVSPADDELEDISSDRVPTYMGGGGTTGEDDAAPTGRPTNNEEWLKRAVSVLTNPPYNYDAGVVYNALRLALDGQPISSTQQAIVSQALMFVGSPPEGMPPTNVTAPTPQVPAPPAPPAAPSPKYATVLAGWRVEQWMRDYRAHPDGIPGFTWEDLQRLNPGVDNNIQWFKDPERRIFKATKVYRTR